MNNNPKQSNNYNSSPHDKKADRTWTIKATLPVSFFVKFSKGILDSNNHDILEIGDQGRGARRLIIVDQTVYNLFENQIHNFFTAHQVDYRLLTIRSHEMKKDMDTLLHILNFMEEFKLKRSGEPILAIGGGVLLDIVGLAATLYRRGVPYIRIPTTLLSLIDASVGVKTGINHFDRRNRLGSYYAPVAAYLDRSLLATLPQKEFSNGCGEILKMAVIKDHALFLLLEKHGKEVIEEKFQHGPVAIEIIHRTIQGMVEELEPNLWEKDMKRVVNFGHSFSPLIEMNALPELSHGEAVALDVLFSCILSCQRGFMKPQDVDRIFKVAKQLELPTFHPLINDLGVLKEALADTIRHRNGAQELPLPISIGKSMFFNDITGEEIEVASAIMKKKHEI